MLQGRGKKRILDPVSRAANLQEDRSTLRRKHLLQVRVGNERSSKAGAIEQRLNSPTRVNARRATVRSHAGQRRKEFSDLPTPACARPEVQRIHLVVDQKHWFERCSRDPGLKECGCERNLPPVNGEDNLAGNGAFVVAGEQCARERRVRAHVKRDDHGGTRK